MPFNIKMAGTAWQNHDSLLFISDSGNSIAIDDAPFTAWPDRDKFSSTFPLEQIDKNLWVMRFKGTYFALKLSNNNQLISAEAYSKKDALSNLDSTVSFRKKTWDLLR
ncbi:MAG: hypothetical protein ACRC9L_09055 [Brevinema sp.]